MFEDGHGRSLGELYCQMDPVLPGAVISSLLQRLLGDDVFVVQCFVGEDVKQDLNGTCIYIYYNLYIYGIYK